MTFKIVIPARFASSRLPGKPLRELAGKPLVEHVYACAIASGADEVVVATDDERIRRTVEEFGGKACMTRAEHVSGTDRIEEVTAAQGWTDETIVVNLQGDEPMMPPRLLRQVAEILRNNTSAAMATLCTPIQSYDEVFNPNIVKVVRDRNNRALLFSRAPIPWDRATFPEPANGLEAQALYARHLGLYAYRVGFLKCFVRWPACELETIESLEQLRALWNGETIWVEEALAIPGHGVDTERDLQAAEEALRLRQSRDDDLMAPNR